MSFSYTTNYAIPKPDVGTELDAWGDDYHTGMDIIDTRMKINADAAAAASTLAGTKANTVHTHTSADITGAMTTAQIADSAITNAKLASMAPNTIKGVTGAGGTPVDLTAAQVNAILGTTEGGTIPAHTHVIDDVATLQATLDAKASAANPTITGTMTAASANFSGVVTAPTAAALTNTTQVATTAHVYESVTEEQPNAQSGTAYTLTASDAGKMVTLNNSAAVTVVINSSVFPANARVDFIQLGAGQVTFGGSATRRSRNGSKLAGQYAGATVWFISSSEYVLCGDVAT